MARRQPHDVAAAVLQKYGPIWMDVPRFSPKWLLNYRPLCLLERIPRTNGLAQFLEALGLLPRNFYRVAHFDADSNVFTIFRHAELMRRAAREVSEAIGVEVSVVYRTPRAQPTRIAG